VFNFIKNTLSKIYNQCTTAFSAFFQREKFDDQAIAELKKILLSADTGIKTTNFIIENLKKSLPNDADGNAMRIALQQELLQLLMQKQFMHEGSIYLLVGINGSGKTTAAAKLAYQEKKAGKKVLLIAADTFRAAATEQLSIWAEKLGVSIVIGKENQDPASVIYTGIQQFKQENFDTLIIDTAGRLQTKINLMKELEKIRKVIGAQLPQHKIITLLTIDAMLGQNSFEQAKTFHESTHLDGIILTKMDGTGKGGIVFAINHELQIPIAFISYGEKPEQLKLFNAQEYCSELLTG
jgi:fused signal recognition particle receptor